MAEKGKEPTERKGERGTKAEQGEYREQSVESEWKADEVEEDEQRKEASQHFCLCQIVIVYVHPVRTYIRTYVRTDRQKNESAHWNSVHCASQALNRQPRGWRGRPTVEKRRLGCGWLTLLSSSEYLSIMTLLCTVAKFGFKGPRCFLETGRACHPVLRLSESQW